MLIEVRSEVAAFVWQVKVAVGQPVEPGDVIVVLESMKIEIPVEAPIGGIVSELRVEPDAQLEEDEVIAVIDDGKGGGP
ncbi:MAG: acetyl-CoA carboxylase biotin carboxyl carrier protein subunit [Acidimicrobiales bacterium]